MLLIASPDEEVKGSMDITASNFLNYTTQGEDNPDEKYAFCVVFFLCK